MGDTSSKWVMIIIPITLIVVGIISSIFIIKNYGTQTGPSSYELRPGDDPGAFGMCCTTGIIALIGGILLIFTIMKSKSDKNVKNS